MLILALGQLCQGRPVASSSQWCGCIFILCYTHLKLALLLHKTVLMNFPNIEGDGTHAVGATMSLIMKCVTKALKSGHILFTTAFFVCSIYLSKITLASTFPWNTENLDKKTKTVK